MRWFPLLVIALAVLVLVVVLIEKRNAARQLEPRRKRKAKRPSGQSSVRFSPYARVTLFKEEEPPERVGAEAEFNLPTKI